MVRIPKYLIPAWDKKIHKSRLSHAKIKLYQYGFTIAARKCGIKSAHEFLDVVSSA